MPSSTSSLSSTSSPSSKSWSSTWLQVVLFTVLVYTLLFSTACCHGKASSSKSSSYIADHSSMSSFPIMVSNVKAQQKEMNEYREHLKELRAEGILDSDNNPIPMSDEDKEMTKLMKEIG